MPTLTRSFLAATMTVLGASAALAHGESPSAGFAQAHGHPHGVEWLIGLAAVAAVAVLFGASRRLARKRVSSRRD